MNGFQVNVVRGDNEIIISTFIVQRDRYIKYNWNQFSLSLDLEKFDPRNYSQEMKKMQLPKHWL